MTRPLSAFVAAALGAALLTLPAAAGVLDRMKATGEVRIAVRADARPLSYMQGGAPQGYSVSLCQTVAREIAKAEGMDGVSYTYVEVNAADRFDAIVSGKADILCGAATVTISRREIVDFSIPTFVDGASLLLRAGGATEFAALEGKRIGVLAATTTETGLRATLASAGMKAEVATFATHGAGVAALAAGDVDAYFGDQSILYALLAESPDRADLRIGRNLLTVEPHALALPLGDTAFRRAVDQALSRMYRKGEVLDAFRRAFPGARPGKGMQALLLIAALPD